MYKFLAILFLVFAAVDARAQFEDANWIIGNNIIDFNTEPPSVRKNTAIKSYPNLTVVSSEDGRLMYFMCNNTIYNREGKVVFKKKDSYSFDYIGGLSIVPFPGRSKCYLFCYHDTENRPWSTVFGIIDGSDDELRPVVTDNYASFDYSTLDGIPLFVNKPDSRSFWLLYNSAKSLEIHSLTPNGIVHESDYDLSGLNLYAGMGSYSVSRDQTKIFGWANGEWNRFLYIDFDNAKGVVRSARTVDVPVAKGAWYIAPMFSPEGKYLYYCRNDYNDRNVYRVPVEYLNGISNVLDKSERVGELPEEALDMRLSSNGDLVILSGSKSLVRVADLDSDTPTITYDYLALVNPTSITSDNQPQFAHTYYYPFAFDCNVDCNTLYYSATVKDLKSALWDFGDGETSSFANGAHIYKNGGKYQVKLTVTFNDDTYNTYTKDVVVLSHVLQKPVILIGKPSYGL